MKSHTLTALQRTVLAQVWRTHAAKKWYRAADSGERVTLASLHSRRLLDRRAWRGVEGERNAAHEYCIAAHVRQIDPPPGVPRISLDPLPEPEPAPDKGATVTKLQPAMTALQMTQQRLDEAVTAVAQAAKEVSEEATPVLRGETPDGPTTFMINWRVMEELNDALKEWKNATQAFLSAEVRHATGG